MNNLSKDYYESKILNYTVSNLGQERDSKLRARMTSVESSSFAFGNSIFQNTNDSLSKRRSTTK